MSDLDEFIVSCRPGRGTAPRRRCRLLDAVGIGISNPARLAHRRRRALPICTN